MPQKHLDHWWGVPPRIAKTISSDLFRTPTAFSELRDAPT